MKKAQIQNMESVTVVIIIIILIMFGMIYAANQKKDSIEKEKEKTRDYEAMEIATNALRLDFIKCSQGGVSYSFCVDYYKIKSLNESTRTEENYMHFYNLFGESEINITVYKNISENLPNELIPLYTTRDTENKTRITIKIPLITEDPVKKMNYFSLMEVSIFR